MQSNRKSADTINGSTTSLNLQDNPEARETMSRNSIAGSIQSLDSLPDAGISLHHTPHNTNKPPDEEAEELDDSKLSCSTFGSPVKEADETKQIDLTQDTVAKVKKSIVQNESIDLTLNDHDYGRVRKSAVLKKVDDDDEVTIIDSKPEIIALSSDDEDEVSIEVIYAYLGFNYATRCPTLSHYIFYLFIKVYTISLILQLLSHKTVLFSYKLNIYQNVITVGILVCI